MTERLTEHFGEKYIRIKGCKSLYENAERKSAPAANVIVRLAAYEDIGLLPDEIKVAQKTSWMETLKDRDAELERLWAEFGDVPMNPETECMDEPFLGFPAGTHREDIWHWFDERHTLGVAYLLNGQSAKGLKPLMLWKDDFVQEHAWNATCEALGVNTSSTEVEVKCIVCVAK